MNFIKEIRSLFLKNSFAKGSATSLIIKFLNTGLQFLVGIALARFLGVEAFGVYSFVYAIIKILSIPTELGLPNLLNKFVPQYHVAKNWASIKGLVKFTNGITLVISFIIIGIVLFLIKSDFLNLSVSESRTLKFGIFLLPILALGNIRGATLRGFRDIYHGLLPEAVLRHFFFGVALIIFYLINEYSGITSNQAILLNIVACFLSYLVGAYWLLKYLPENVKASYPEFEFRIWLKTSLPFLLIGGIQIILSKIDTVFIGFLRSPEEVGLYEVAFKTAALTSFTLGALNFVLAPYYSKYFHEDKFDMLQKISSYAVLFNAFISFLILTILYIYGNDLLILIFGKEYSNSYAPMLVIITGQFFGVIMGSVAILLNMTGYQNTVLKIFGVATLLNVILNYIFIPKYGLMGAAYTSLFSTVLWKVLMYIQCRKIFNVDTTIFYALKKVILK